LTNSKSWFKMFKMSKIFKKGPRLEIRKTQLLGETIWDVLFGESPLEPLFEKIGDILEGIIDKVDESYLFHKMRVLMLREGILDEDLLPTYSNEKLLDTYSRFQKLVKATEEVIEQVTEQTKDSSKSQETQRYIEEYEAALEGFKKDIGIIKKEIERRGLNIPESEVN
jgi:hypothetical protein